MANVVNFQGERFRLDVTPDPNTGRAGRTWVALGEDPDGHAKLLNDYTANLPGPGPADGFTTLGRHLAQRVAADFRGTVEELDAVTIPDDPPGTVY